MKPVSLSSLTLSDLEDSGALDSIQRAAELLGVSPEKVLAEVTTEPLTLDELTIGLQCRADKMVDDYHDGQALLFTEPSTC